MYRPQPFDEERIEVMHALMQRHSLATLVTVGPAGLAANHVPLLLDPEPAPYGTLRGHVARANPMWREFDAQTGALAVFVGPQAYITPSWYPTKRATGRVVPTWNYAAVHAAGPLVVHDDVGWLRNLVTQLTQVHETAQPQPWQVGDAPADFIDTMLKAIVGIEIPIRRLEGKWKASQNRGADDRAGVAEGLRALGDDQQRAMANIVTGGFDKLQPER